MILLRTDKHAEDCECQQVGPRFSTEADLVIGVSIRRETELNQGL